MSGSSRKPWPLHAAGLRSACASASTRSITRGFPGTRALPAGGVARGRAGRARAAEAASRTDEEVPRARIRDDRARDGVERRTAGRRLVGARRVEDPDAVTGRRRLREERHDRDAGVVVHEHERRDPQLEVAVEQVRRAAEVERAEVAARVLRAGRPEQDGTAALLRHDRRHRARARGCSSCRWRASTIARRASSGPTSSRPSTSERARPARAAIAAQATATRIRNDGSAGSM